MLAHNNSCIFVFFQFSHGDTESTKPNMFQDACVFYVCVCLFHFLSSFFSSMAFYCSLAFRFFVFANNNERFWAAASFVDMAFHIMHLAKFTVIRAFPYDSPVYMHVHVIVCVYVCKRASAYFMINCRVSSLHIYILPDSKTTNETMQTQLWIVKSLHAHFFSLLLLCSISLLSLQRHFTILLFSSVCVILFFFVFDIVLAVCHNEKLEKCPRLFTWWYTKMPSQLGNDRRANIHFR